MLTPKQLDDIPENLIKLYSQAELDILANMCRRIANYDYFIPAAEFQYKKMIEMGNTHDEILKSLSEMSGISREHIIKLMEDAGAKAIAYDDRIYKIANSLALQNILKEGIDKTNNLFANLTQTTVKATSRQIEIALDNAYMQITSGAFDRTTAITNAVKFLSGNGIAAFEYKNSFNYLESAVRRAILTGVNQTCCKMQIARADEMGSDLIEVTAHAGARTGDGIADHAFWQGKVYSRSGNSKKYPDFISSTGYGSILGLGGVNCRHNFFPFIEGISKRAYTDEQLEDYKGENYTYNGEDLTEYEATQKQRQIERNIRKYKREYVALKEARLPTDEAEAYILKWQKIQSSFINQTGLKRQRDREKVANISTKSFTQTEKEKIHYIKIVKPNEPKIFKADNIELQHKINYDIITKEGTLKQGIVPSKTTLENITVIAGYGSSTHIRNAKKLAQSYGGDYWRWQKKTGTVESKYGKYEVHWYEYNGLQYEEKLKSWREK